MSSLLFQLDRPIRQEIRGNFRSRLSRDRVKQSLQLFFQGMGGHRGPGLPIPVSSVAVVAFDPMQIGVNQAGVAIVVGLHQIVSGIPLPSFGKG